MDCKKPSLGMSENFSRGKYVQSKLFSLKENCYAAQWS